MWIVKNRKFGVRSKIFLLSRSVQDYGNRWADFYLVMQAVGWARYYNCMWTLQSLWVNSGYFLIVFPFRSALETSATAPPPPPFTVCLSTQHFWAEVKNLFLFSLSFWALLVPGKGDDSLYGMGKLWLTGFAPRSAPLRLICRGQPTWPKTSPVVGCKDRVMFR